MSPELHSQQEGGGLERFQTLGCYCGPVLLDSVSLQLVLALPACSHDEDCEQVRKSLRLIFGCCLFDGCVVWILALCGGNRFNLCVEGVLLSSMEVSAILY